MIGILIITHVEINLIDLFMLFLNTRYVVECKSMNAMRTLRSNEISQSSLDVLVQTVGADC